MYKILANTIFLGKDVRFLPECHSTNDKAMELIRLGSAAEGTIVITDHQTKGKGQRGNTWEAQAGKNLTFSLILKPGFLDVSEQFYLNMVVSNGLLRFFSDYIPDLKVKWPNDLVVPQLGKMGGILIENIVGQQGWEYSIVGIGLNINQQSFGVTKATSLSSLTGSEFRLEELFKLIISHLEQAYLSLKKGRKSELKRDYLRHLFLLEEWNEFSKNELHFVGKIRGVTETGKLQIEMENGDLEEFGLKEVSFPNI